MTFDSIISNTNTSTYLKSLAINNANFLKSFFDLTLGIFI